MHLQTVIIIIFKKELKKYCDYYFKKYCFNICTKSYILVHILRSPFPPSQVVFNVTMGNILNETAEDS